MIYVSGAITGVQGYEYHFRCAEYELKERGHEAVVNPAKVAETLPPMTHDEYMTVCMALLSLCDTIYMLKGYERSKGAMQELEYAKKNGYKVVYEE